MPITSDKRVQVLDWGSLIKNPMYIGKVHLALGGRVKVLMDYEIQAKTSILRGHVTQFSQFINA